jgi:proteasome component ECM29
MTRIWQAFVQDEKKGIEEHFDAIMKELLSSSTSNLWRQRQAGCLGLSDLIRGRQWGEVSAHFKELWVVALRALDDLKVAI